MALTRDFKETVKARADRDPAFREALLTEAVEHLIAGKVEVAGKGVQYLLARALEFFERHPGFQRGMAVAHVLAPPHLFAFSQGLHGSTPHHQPRG